jgi:hypothetical protein
MKMKNLLKSCKEDNNNKTKDKVFNNRQEVKLNNKISRHNVAVVDNLCWALDRSPNNCHLMNWQNKPK